MSELPPVLLLCKDLFFGSQLHGAVQRGGRTPRTCLSQTGCLNQIEAVHPDCIVADVELPELDFQALRQAAGPDCQLIAFGPHVHVDLLEGAAAAGCSKVLTRGQTCAWLEGFLRSQAAQSE